MAERRGHRARTGTPPVWLDRAQSGDLGLPKEVSVVWGPEGRSEPLVVEYLVTDHEWDNQACFPREDTTSHVSQGACPK